MKKWPKNKDKDQKQTNNIEKYLREKQIIKPIHTYKHVKIDI